MRIFGKTVAALYILAGLFLVISFLIIWANPISLSIITEFLKYRITVAGSIAIGLVILGVLYIVNWIEFVNKMKNVSFDNPGGKVKISLKAIEDSITALILKQVEGIKSLKVKNFVSPRGLETRIFLKLISGLNIPETCATVQELTKNYLQDAVGIERVANIEVNVTHIVEGEYIFEGKEEKRDENQQNNQENEQLQDEE